MDELTTLTPCWCVACGELVLTSEHRCEPRRRPSRLERIVLYTMRRDMVRALAMKRRGK
jgi:hypothetical protein